MPLNSQLKSVLQAMGLGLNAEGTASTSVSTPVSFFEEGERRQQSEGLKPLPVGRVEDVHIDGPERAIPLRVYTPEGEGPFKLITFFHGGGWFFGDVCGDLDSHDQLCRELCAGSRSVVVAVDYRRSPQHKCPAAAEDCYAATVWASMNASKLAVDPACLIVAGDSVGGNLAAVVALLARDNAAEGKLAPVINQQLLLYPVLNHNFETQSYQDNAAGYWVGAKEMKWFWQHYLTDDAQGLEQYASPLQANSFEGLPPALIITTEYDPLRDEGESYAQALMSVGVRVEVVRYAGQIHGFVSLSPMLDDACSAIKMVNDKLNELA